MIIRFLSIAAAGWLLFAIDCEGKQFEARGMSAEGMPIDWSDYEGKVVLANFWAAWSGSCLAEIPEL